MAHAKPVPGWKGDPLGSEESDLAVERALGNMTDAHAAILASIAILSDGDDYVVHMRQTKPLLLYRGAAAGGGGGGGGGGGRNLTAIVGVLDDPDGAGAWRTDPGWSRATGRSPLDTADTRLSAQRVMDLPINISDMASYAQRCMGGATTRGGKANPRVACEINAAQVHLSLLLAGTLSTRPSVRIDPCLGSDPSRPRSVFSFGATGGRTGVDGAVTGDDIWRGESVDTDQLRRRLAIGAMDTFGRVWRTPNKDPRVVARELEVETSRERLLTKDALKAAAAAATAAAAAAADTAVGDDAEGGSEMGVEATGPPRSRLREAAMIAEKEKEKKNKGKKHDVATVTFSLRAKTKNDEGRRGVEGEDKQEHEHEHEHEEEEEEEEEEEARRRHQRRRRPSSVKTSASPGGTERGREREHKHKRKHTHKRKRDRCSDSEAETAAGEGATPSAKKGRYHDRG
jgi:hypothetical protein